MPKPIELIITDMDGTFLHHDNEVSPANHKAFWDAWNKGIHLAICSGRSPKDVISIIKAQKLPPCYVLGYNGAYCFDLNGNVMDISRIETQGVKACVEIFTEEKIAFAIMTEKRIALNKDPEGDEVANKGSMAFTKKEWTDITWDEQTFEQALEEGVCKMLYIDRRKNEELARIRQRVEKIESLGIMRSWHNNIEIMAKGVNKGTASAKLAQKLNVMPQKVLAFGDQENDVEMLAFAGVGVAMENAAVEAKAAAKYKTAHHQEDGVAKGIYHFAALEQ